MSSPKENFTDKHSPSKKRTLQVSDKNELTKRIRHDVYEISVNELKDEEKGNPFVIFSTSVLFARN